MIENYWYSIPKWKKLSAALLLVFVLMSFPLAKMNCGVFDWFTKKATTNITNEIFDGLNESINETLGGVLDGISNAFTEPFGPQVETFVENTNIGDISADKLIKTFGIYVGVFTGILILLFSLYSYMFRGKITDCKDTPVSLFFRYLIAMGLIYNTDIVIDTFIDIIDTIYTSAVKNAISNAIEEGNTMGNVMGALIGKMVSTLLKKFLEGIAESMIPGIGFIIMVITLVMIWIVLKGFFKLFAEMISRYIVSMVLVFMMPAFAGTIVSNNTSQIFKSYVRTVFSSFLVLLFNILWFKICLLAAIGSAYDTDGVLVSFSIMQYIFLLELLHLGLKIDGLLRSMGLGVATGGSRIVSAVGGSGRSLANSLRNANDTRKAAGNLLKAGGLLAGNKDMYNAGKTISASASDFANGTAKDSNSAFGMAADLGAKGKKISDDLVTNGEAANIMKRAMDNPNDKDAQNAMSALSSNKLASGAQVMMGNGYKVQSAEMKMTKGADGKNHATVAVKAQKANDDGSFADMKDAEHNKAFTATIGGDGTFSSGMDLEGGSEDSEGLSMKCDDSLSNGDTCSIDDAPFMAGQDVSDALANSGIDESEFEGGTVEKVGRNDDGEDSFRVYDSGNNVMGSVSGDEYTPSLSSMSESDRIKELSAIRDDIKEHNSDLKVSNFRESPDKEGEYTAVATGIDADGKAFTQVYTVNDRGAMPTAKVDKNNTDSFLYKNKNSKVTCTVNAGKYRYQKKTK